MKALKWPAEDLIMRNVESQAAIAGLVMAAGKGEMVMVQIERWPAQQILGRSDAGACSNAQLRAGCIKAVESHIWPLPQKGRVLAEINRRFDQVLDPNCGSDAWLSGLESIFSYAGAWALAAQLLRDGLRVYVVEEEQEHAPVSNERADVNIVIPIGPTNRG